LERKEQNLIKKDARAYAKKAVESGNDMELKIFYKTLEKNFTNLK